MDVNLKANDPDPWTAEMKAALRASEERFRTTLRCIGDAVILVDVNGRVELLNPVAEALTGWSETEARGRPLEEIFHIVNEYTRAPVDNPVQRVLREGIVVGLANHTLLISRDGVERPIIDSGAPVRNDAGQISGVVLVFRDQSAERAAQRAVAAARDLAEGIVAAVREPLLILDADLNVVAANRAFYQVFQVEPAETISRKIYELGNRQWDIPRLRQLLEDILPSNSHFDDFPVEHEFPRLGRRVMLLNARRITREEQKTNLILLAIEDVTARMDAEKALRENERLFRTLAETTPIGIFIYSGENFVYVNRAAEALTGYSRAELLKMSFWDMVHPDHREQVRQRGLARQRGEPVSPRFEFKAIRKDGQVRWVDFYAGAIEWQGQPAAIGSAVDVTERKQAEEALRRSEERYRLISELVSDYAYAFRVEPDGRLVREWLIGAFTPITGYTSEEVDARGGWPSLIYPEDMPIAEARARKLLSGQEDVSEFRILTKSSQVVWVRDHGRPVWDEEQKRVVAIYGAAQDITSRKERERQLEAMVELAAALRQAESRADMPAIFLESIMAVLEADGAVLESRDPEGNALHTELGLGVWKELSGVRLVPGSGISAAVLETGRPYVTSDVLADPRLIRPDLIGESRAVMGLPLIAQGQITGLVWVCRKRPFSDWDVRLLTILAEIAASAMQRAELAEQASQRLRLLTALHHIDRAISASTDMRLALGVITDQARELLQVDAAAVLLFDPLDLSLKYAAGSGFRSAAIAQSHLRVGQGNGAGRAALERRIISLPDVRRAQPPFLRLAMLEEEGFITYHAVPLIAKGQLLGVLEIFHRRLFVSSNDWLNMLQTLSTQAAIAVDNARLFDNLQRGHAELNATFDAVLAIMGRLIDLREQGRHGHSEEVAEQAARLARRLGMSEIEVEMLRRGALLHDLGMLLVPESVLHKPAPLSDAEWELVRRHPQVAYDLLAPIPLFRPAVDVPYAHHEKWDGTGYPRGLKGEGIPLAARLFAIVDVYDALTHPRPHRPAWSLDKARAYLAQQAGQHFDPGLVEAFLKLLAEG